MGSCLHASFSHPLLAELQGAGSVPASSLMWPVFTLGGGASADACEPIAALPGQSRLGVSALVAALAEPVANGLASVILFGVLPPGAVRDATGSAADAADAPVPATAAALRAAYPRLLIAADLCLCAYTSHGHCGVLRADGSIDNAASVARLAAIAVAFARAGAQVIAPSDMMDGRVAAIKAALRADGGGLDARVAVMSYAAKFASCFYGPFRDAARSGIAGGGDRSLYQLPPAGR